MNHTQTPRDLCKCGAIAMTQICNMRLCRACCAQIRARACEELGRRHHVAARIGCVPQLNWMPEAVRL